MTRRIDRVHEKRRESFAPTEPAELWNRAGGDAQRFRELMAEAGHLLPPEPCPTCGQTFHHRHAGGALIRTDIFGHDLPA